MKTAMTREEMGRVIRTYRKKAGLTQKEVSAILGKSQQTITVWENGNAQPDMENFLRLCNVCRIPVNEAFDLPREFDLVSEKTFQKIYEGLDIHGKQVVQMVLMEEHKRCEKERLIQIEEDTIPFPDKYPDVSQADINSLVARIKKLNVSDVDIAKAIHQLKKCESVSQN